MADILCDLFNIENKHLRRFLKVLFIIIGLIPYVVIFFVINKLSLDNFGEYKTPFSFLQIFTILACMGGCTYWFFFCKLVKGIFLYIRSD